MAQDTEAHLCLLIPFPLKSHCAHIPLHACTKLHAHTQTGKAFPPRGYLLGQGIGSIFFVLVLSPDHEISLVNCLNLLYKSICKNLGDVLFSLSLFIALKYKLKTYDPEKGDH